MTVRNVDLWAGVVTTLMGMVATFYLIPVHVSGGFGFGLSPRFFPYICSIAITVLGVILMVSRALGKGGSSERSPLNLRVCGRLLALTALLGASLLVMTLWGYLPAAMLMIATFMLAMGERRVLWIVPMSVCWPLFLWLLFEKLLDTPLPG